MSTAYDGPEVHGAENTSGQFLVPRRATHDVKLSERVSDPGADTTTTTRNLEKNGRETSAWSYTTVDPCRKKNAVLLRCCFSHPGLGIGGVVA